MRILVFTLLFLTTSIAEAQQHKRVSGLYSGFGFGFSSVTLQPNGQPKSSFSGWHGAIEAGINFKLADSFGVNLAGEYLTTDVENTIDSPTYMENADIKAAAGKFGFFWRDITIGVGYTSTKVNVKNVSSSSASNENNFSGSPLLVYANYGFEKDSLRGVIEVKHASGELEDIKYTDLSVGIKLVFLFGR